MFIKRFVRLEANARRKNKEDGEEDVVYAPPIRQSSYSESSSEGYVPTGALERNKAVRERDVQGENSHVAEYVSQPHRVPKPAPIVDHQSNYYDIKAKASAADHNPYSNRDKPRGQAAAAIPTVQAVKAHSAQNDYESIVTRYISGYPSIDSNSLIVTLLRIVKLHKLSKLDYSNMRGMLT